MEFRKKKWKEETRTLVDSKRQKWSYISAKDMRQQYPNGGYLILVDLKAGKKENAVGYLTQDDKKIEVFPYKTKLKVGETCVGFLQVESNVHKDTFVRVVKQKKIPPLCYLYLLGIFSPDFTRLPDPCFKKSPTFFTKTLDKSSKICGEAD